MRIRESAVAGDFALVGGYSALMLARVLAEQVTGGLDGALGRMAVGPEGRDRVLRAYLALEQVGAAWRDERNASAGSGNAAVDASAEDIDSNEWISTSEAALLLGVMARRVRQLALAGDLPGRLRSGRWKFQRSEVLGLCARRATGRAA